MVATTERYTFIRPDLSDVEVSLPDVAGGPGVGSSFGVLKFGKIEVELNDSKVELLPEYFAAGSATPEDEITLSSGLPVVVGRIDPGAGAGGGLCFGVKVDARCLLGSVGPNTTLDVLASWLSDLQIGSKGSGLKVTPAKAKWSTERAPNVAVGLSLRSGQSTLLDIRPAFRNVAQSRIGVQVQGGFLSRQGRSDLAEYLVLNAPEHVVYILGSSKEQLDEVAELGSGLTVRSVVN